MHELTVSIVSHGHKEYLDACLNSVFRASGSVDLEVYLVVNTPGDGTETLVRSRYPSVRVLANQRPRGFSENHNRVYRATRSKYFLLLNPDTVAFDGSLARLVGFLDETPQAGACGPKLVYPDGRLQLSCRYFPTIGSVLVRRTPLRKAFPNSKLARDYTMADWDHNSVREVDWVFGACLMVRRAAADSVGLLDEDLYLFCEDIDWCYRIKKAGWKIFYVPEAVVQHDLDDASYERYWGRQRFLHYASMYRYLKKHMVPWNRAKWLAGPHRNGRREARPDGGQ
jgi:GT2 family glycosyltransferase